MAGYWTKVAQNRTTRRRMLAATAGTAFSAAFLAACGGDSDSPTTTTGPAGTGPASTGPATTGGTGPATGAPQASSLIELPVDTTNQATRGGTLKWFAPGEPNNLDVFQDQAPKNVHKNMGYSHYIIEKPGYLGPPKFEEFEGDVMESWEWAADGLQLTFKLRPNVKFHNKPPVNGRTLDVQDVIYSWERWSEMGTDRQFLSNAANPAAPVLSVTATDDRTVVMQLREPTVFLLPALTPIQTGKPSIIPREVEGGFDIRSEMIGSGPFMLDNYTPTVGFTYKRHPEYWDPTYPLIDTVEMPLIPEYAAALAQLKAGGLHTYSSGNATVQAEDIVPLHRDVPDIKIYEFLNATFAVRQLTFGWLPTEANKPFKDDRVRKAVSMSWDRDSYIDAFGNVSRFEAEGIPMETFWNTNLHAGAGAWWLDPQSTEFGPHAKWYQFDLAEARALLAAAGYGDGVDVTSMYIGGPQLGGDFQRTTGVCDEFAAQAGFRVTTNVIDYTAEYIPVLRDGRGQWEGWGYRAGGAPANDAVAYLTTLYHSTKGQQFLGFDAAGVGDSSGDPEVEAMLSRAQGETDSDARRAIVFDIQRHLADKMYMVPHPPSEATRFYVAWSAVRNFQVFQGDRRQPPFHWWIDETQPPN